MDELVRFIARSLVDDPDAVQVETKQDGDCTVIELHVAPGDVVSVPAGRDLPALAPVGKARVLEEGRVHLPSPLAEKVPDPQVGVVLKPHVIIDVEEIIVARIRENAERHRHQPEAQLVRLAEGVAQPAALQHRPSRGGGVETVVYREQEIAVAGIHVEPEHVVREIPSPLTAIRLPVGVGVVETERAPDTQPRLLTRRQGQKGIYRHPEGW